MSGRTTELGNDTPNVVPPTPGTPSPLLSLQARVESASYDRLSMQRCKCLPVGSHANPDHYLVDFKVPDVSLTKKVPTLNSFLSLSK